MFLLLKEVGMIMKWLCNDEKLRVKFQFKGSLFETSYFRLTFYLGYIVRNVERIQAASLIFSIDNSFADKVHSVSHNIKDVWTWPDNRTFAYNKCVWSTPSNWI